MNLYDYLYFCACANLGRVVVDASPFENEARQTCVELPSESWREFLFIQNHFEFFSTQPAPENASLHVNDITPSLLHIGDAVWWQINNIGRHNNVAILPLHDDIISKISAYLGLMSDTDMEDDAEYDAEAELSDDDAAAEIGDENQENRDSNLSGPSYVLYSFHHPAGPSKTPGPTHNTPQFHS